MVCSDLQMLFVTDVLCMIPVPTTINDVIQTFKFDSLYVLFDSVTELQLARELPSFVCSPMFFFLGGGILYCI